MSRLSKRASWFGTLVMLGVLAAGGYALGFVLPELGGGSSEESAASMRALVGRPWLDHLPEGEMDRYKALLFDKKGYGVELEASAYRGDWEIFLFREKDQRIEVVYPHDKRRFVTRYSIEKTKHKTFDLVLTLPDLPSEPRTFYSWKHFRRDLPDAEPALRSLALDRWLAPQD